MFREFDRIEIDLNQFGDVTPLNEDRTNPAPRYRDENLSEVTKDGKTVLSWVHLYKAYYETDNERINKCFECNIRTVKNGMLSIENATILPYINASKLDIDDNLKALYKRLYSYNLYEIYEICVLRIWYYLGMPQMYFSSGNTLSAMIGEKEDSKEYEFVIRANAFLPMISFQKGERYYEIFSEITVYGIDKRDGCIPDLPVSYRKMK